MAEKSTRKRAKEIYKTADVFSRNLTGKSLKDNLKSGVAAIIDTIESKVSEEDQPAATQGQVTDKLKEAYLTLHCLPADEDSRIRSVFQDLVKMFHPEIGSQKSESEFYRVCDCYNRIMQSRHPDFNREEKE
jgi:hypothetical protein